MLSCLGWARWIKEDMTACAGRGDDVQSQPGRLLTRVGRRAIRGGARKVSRGKGAAGTCSRAPEKTDEGLRAPVLWRFVFPVCPETLLQECRIAELGKGPFSPGRCGPQSQTPRSGSEAQPEGTSCSRWASWPLRGRPTAGRPRHISRAPVMFLSIYRSH